MDYSQGDSVWFDPGTGFLIPGEVTECHRAGQVVKVQATMSGKIQSFTLTEPTSLRPRQDIGPDGVHDLTEMTDVHEASLLWNLKVRYERNIIYTYVGSILISINPYRMHNIYGLDIVRQYETEIMGTLPPHIFAVASAAYASMIRHRRPQAVLMTGLSGAGKTEAAKLVQQYLAAVNKSPSNLVTEQILEATPLFESFGNAKSALNDNASRFGKYLEIFFKEGMISGARVTPYLLDKWRVVSHGARERNFHVFYEMLSGLGESERGRYGLQTAQHYFYLNQGSSLHIEGKMDAEDFQSLLSSLQVLGFSIEEQEVIFKILASVLHLGNIYFHKASLRSGQETVEMGSDAEVRWVAFLLALNPQTVRQSLISRSAENGGQSVVMPLNQSQALDVRDSLARLLYAGLFNWLLERVNAISYHGNRRMCIALLDMFGFENLQENSFEQLCINYTNEQLQHQFIKSNFHLEQQEYAREKIDWFPVQVQDNTAVLQLITKKATGLFCLLDDECNFPKATDSSLLDKFHFNHALNELYSRSREVSLEFSIHHYAGVVNYSVDGFLEKNRDIVRYNLIDLLLSSQSRVVVDVFEQFVVHSGAVTPSGGQVDNRFVTMKPRSPTVAARYHDNLQQLLESINKCQHWYVRCLRPGSRAPTAALDTSLLLAQLRHCCLADTVCVRQRGYPVRHSFVEFAQRYRCLLRPATGAGTADDCEPVVLVMSPGHRAHRSLRSAVPSRDLCRLILEQNPAAGANGQIQGAELPAARGRSSDHYRLGISSVLLRERYSRDLEQFRLRTMTEAAIVLQAHTRRYLASRRLVTMRQAALIVQSVYRMYRQRRRYRQIRSGLVKAQAQYRMVIQRRRFQEMKSEMVRRVMAERDAQQKIGRQLTNGDVQRDLKSVHMTNGLRSRHAVAAVSHLDVPEDLARIFSKVQDWQPLQSERNLMKLNSSVDPPEERFSLPHDIDYHAFTKYANVNFKSHLWGMKREPIRAPLLAKSRDCDYADSLAIFRLILKFMNDENLTGYREKALGDYIVYKGLTNFRLRDEILCQLCNQTCKNGNSDNCERGWLLLSNCLSVFPPSDALYKYLLKYVSDHGPSGYGADCQKKLLRSPPDGRLCRKYPPTQLEWRCNQKKLQMALETVCADGLACHVPLDSWTTGEEMAAYVLENRGIGSTFGWTVRVGELAGCGPMAAGGAALDDWPEISCIDYVLDGVAAGELVPELVELSPSSSRSLSGAAELAPSVARLNGASEGGAGAGVENGRFATRTVHDSGLLDTVDVDTALDSGDCGDDEANSPQIANSSMTRTKGHVGAMTQSNSQLYSKPIRGSERRYGPPSMDGSMGTRSPDIATQADRQLANGQDVLDSARSRSLDDLLQEDGGQHRRKNELTSKTSRDMTSMSGSRLNSHFHSVDVINEPASQRVADGAGGWSQYGLSESALNGRYFVSKGKLMDTDSDAGLVPSGVYKGRRFSDGRGQANERQNDPTQRAGRNSRSRHHSPARRVSGVSSTRDPSGHAVRSSAMSDTSEAPSLASHVRRVRVPSHASDMDQYVDELFLPVLDEPALEDLTDARTLAASIRGEAVTVTAAPHCHLTELPSAPLDLDTDPQCEVTACETIAVNDLWDMFCTEETGLRILTDVALLADCINGEAEPSAQSSNQLQSPYLLQPMTSPVLNSATPLVPATPLPYTQPPVGMSLPTVFAGSRTGLPDTVPANFNSADPQQMALFQQMFIQSAVAQNMQIQQQLLTQNQALTQLLQASASQNNSLVQSSSPPKVDPGQMTLSPFATSPDPTTASQSAPNTDIALSKQSRSVEDVSMFSDPSHSRARTVRIGKWRWPPLEPPGGDAANQLQPDNFLEFKHRAQQRKRSNHQRSLSIGDLMDEQQQPRFASHRHHASGRDEPALDWNQRAGFDTNQHSSIASESSHASSQPTSDNNAASPVLRALPTTEQQSIIESVSRLKISSALKKKLEAVTSTKSRANHDTNDACATNDSHETVDAPSHRSIRKLDQSRKLLLERKLSGLPSHSTDQSSGSSDHNSKKSPTKMHPVNRVDKSPMSPTSLPVQPLHIHIPTSGRKTSRLSSSDSSPDRIRDWSPPRPIQPIREGRSRSLTNQTTKRSSLSENTHAANKFEVEESEEFLMPVDTYNLLESSNDPDHVTETERHTQLYPPSSAPFVTYCHVPWKLDIRKEVFSPTEDVTNATALHLVFCQIVVDVFNAACIRITPAERQHMRQLFDEMKISPDNISSPQIKLALKRSVLEVAKQWPTYFCIFFPVTIPGPSPGRQLLALSHSGVYMVKIVVIDGLKAENRFLQILDHIRFAEIVSVDATLPGRVQMVLSNGVHHVLVTNKATVLADMLDRFMAEAKAGTHEYMRAVTNYQSNDASLLSFKKGDIIRIIKKSHGSQQGWLFGILEGRRGLISSDCVVAVQKQPISSGRKLLGTGSNSAITAGNYGADSDASGGSPASDAHITGAVTSSDWLTRDVTEPVDRQVASPVGGPQSPVSPTLVDDGKHSLLQFAMLHFRDADEKYNMLRSDEGETAGSSVKHDTKHKKSKKKSKTDWTWREQVEMVKWTSEPLSASLLKLESAEMNRLALDCFGAVQRYMGEQAMPQGTSEVDCVYAILMSCHRYPTLCDEVYCQLMRQTTSNRSQHADSCQRGWRLLGIVAAYFTCSDQLRPYLFKYLETAAYDKRRAYHGTALVCLHNLRKTVRYGGRKNVPSVEEITAVTAGRNSKRQLYRLPGGTERVINTKSCSVVQDIIEEICEAINITNAEEVNEYSLYCIVEGDTFTMPLAREEYILDVTTELQKNDQIFYLIFCRSVWFFPLRLDSQLYVEVVFNQITPDYLEGLLLVMPGETLQEQTVYDISRVAALLHRAADMETVPSMKETKYLLPKAALMVRDIKPPQWVNMVQSSWSEVQHHTGMQSKTAVLEILQNWPLFGSSFFAVSRMIDNRDAVEHILALNRAGVHFLDTITHETLAKYPFSEVISTRKVKTEDGTLFLDMKCGNLMMQKVVRIQSDNAHEISRLIRQYISIEQRQRSSLVDTAAVIADSSREGQASR